MESKFYNQSVSDINYYYYNFVCRELSKSDRVKSPPPCGMLTLDKEDSPLVGFP